MPVTLEHSSFIDFTGYRVTSATTAPAAYGFDDGRPFNPASESGINVAIVLPRANDPTALLAGDWGSRQQALQQLNADGTLWTTYGSDPGVFAASLAILRNELGLKVLDSTNSNYVTSAESRTIWIEISRQADFQNLFGTELRYSPSEGLLFWDGDLSLPDQLRIAGLWFDVSTIPPGSNLTPGVSVTLPQGPQSIGNSAPTTEATNLVPQAMAVQYNFPLDGAAVQTKKVGLIEPGIGSALPGDRPGVQFQAKLTDYLTAIGQSGDGIVSVQGVDGQIYDDSKGERSLDVSIVAGVNPNSDIVLFNGSGLRQGFANATTYTAIQSATFPGAGQQPVVAWSDSFGDAQSMSPDSPFYRAYWELYVDTALANQTAVTALGDGGSSEEIGNGLTNLEYNCTQPYSLLVGGSSLSLLSAAQTDPTLATAILAPALLGDPNTIWQLVIGGLTTLPANMQSNQFFVETAWNFYNVADNTITGTPFFNAGYVINSTTNGGVDPTQPVPSYQVAYGLNPTTSDPLGQVGRGAPDVTADGGGNATYQLADADMNFTNGYFYGTSAASPLWASLIVQIDTIFEDQGLPDLGYAHDLLYLASAIAPASFNDLTLGNNISSWVYGGPYQSNGTAITPTGFGYYAGPGYDLVSGLGSPNGTLLARTLSAAAHAQMYFSDVPSTIVGDLASGWTSGAAQSLLFQTMSASGVNVGVTTGSGGFAYASGPSDAYAWTSRLAMQSLQSDFDPALVRMFDKQAQGVEMQAFVAAGQALDVSIAGQDAQAIQGGLTGAFGFADFMSSDGVVRVARPVAVAETAGGQDDQQAVVRVRQNGEDSLTVSFYRIDDFAGTIDGLQPGQAGYAAAAQVRAYQLTTAGGPAATSLAGPGYGNYTQAMLQDVDAGDLIAMKLTDNTKGFVYWAFAQANEMVDGQPVGHIWSYGLNTWGWEDTYGLGDHDYNDLVVQLDFTSASGHGWLIG